MFLTAKRKGIMNTDDKNRKPRTEKKPLSKNSISADASESSQDQRAIFIQEC